MMRSCESGNVLFYILLAVGLLGALSFAVARSDGSSANRLKTDQARLYASEIIEYGDIVKKAVVQLRLRGTALSDLSFAHDDALADYGVYGTSPEDEVFNPEGGRVIYKSFLSEVFEDSTARAFEVLSHNDVHGVGTNCAGVDCSDLIMVLPVLRQSVCMKINDLLGIDNPSDNAPSVTDIHMADKFAGFMGSGTVIGDSSAPFAGKTAGCFQETGEVPSYYYYYQVLIAR